MWLLSDKLGCFDIMASQKFCEIVYIIGPNKLVYDVTHIINKHKYLLLVILCFTLSVLISVVSYYTLQSPGPKSVQAWACALQRINIKVELVACT